MSIEITGPERYEFQYYVTLELVLRLWAYDVRAVVDSGGEDSTLEFQVDGQHVVLELQVKGAEHHTKAVDDAVLLEYLAHFPSRSSTNSLLERLLKEPSKLVILVCAQRAMDFASPLTVRSDWRGKTHRTPPLTATAAQSFLTQIVASKPNKDSGLERKRAADLSALGKAISATQLNEAFKRLFLQDNVTKENVTARLFEHLRELAVPSDRAEGALLQMLQRVRDSKGTGVNLVPALKTVLTTEVVPSVRPSDYVSRGAEKAWGVELADKRALLLSGPPRCGKTDAAKWIAADLQMQGFEVVRLSLVDEAERVLLDRRRTEIVVVLDDPLGSDLEANSKAGQALKSLDRLIRELEQNRRLIVAQSQEALLAARASDSLGKVKTGGLSWHDLGAYPPGFLSQVWDRQAQSNEVPIGIKNAIATAIAAGDLDVPAGVLAHVAAYHEQLQGADVVRQAQSLASESATDFAMTLRTSGAVEVTRALAIGSTAVETSGDRDLAFILGEGQEFEIPSLLGASVFSLGDELDEHATAPSYTEAPVLPKSARESLTNLELHRVLRRREPNHFQFSHPYYRSAARALVRQAVSMERDDVLSAIRRGLFSPSPSTSAAAARNLWWLHRDLGEALGLGEALVKLAESGLRWYFPTTRDLCYEFLLEVVQAEPEKYLERLQHWVNSMTRIKFEDVSWDHGEPFFPFKGEYSIPSFLRKVPVPDEARVRKTVAKLRASDALPNSGSAAEALRFFKTRPSELDSAAMLRLLGFSEGLIRAEAAYTWLLVERTNDVEILERLRRDTHPSVVSRMLRAVTKAWDQVGPNRREILAALLRASIDQPETAAIVVSGLLNHFYSDDDYALGRDRASKPWALVGEVLAPALRGFPNSFRMAGERLYDVCNTALTYLSPSSSEAVINAWIDWLQTRIAAGYLPDDYMLGLVTSSLNAPALSAQDRRAAIERLLAVPSTGAVLVFVANLVARWSDLRDAERLMVMKLLVSEREDEVWMKAAALTQDSVPAEIQELLLGAVDGFHVPVPQFVDRLAPSLLTACVQMHRGSPQPLWYLGHHHDHSPTWMAVIRQLARTPTHPLFEDCLDELFSFEERYGAEELSQVIRELDASSRERVFGLLLAWKTGVVGDWHQPEFDLLLELAPDDHTRTEMVGRMVKKSDQIIESTEDVDKWSHRPDVREALKDKFLNDFVIRDTWEALKSNNAQLTLELRTMMSELLVSLVETHPPALPSTYWDVDRYLKTLDAGGDFLSRAGIVRERAIITFGKLRFSGVRPPSKRLPDWIGPG
ncbi:hypothetical protein UB44_17665 [Burkholderiaceae bacterium 26]|nr:hypothetical protein UB44_17665 [Burkholderiaceae bacterium 26]